MTSRPQQARTGGPAGFAVPDDLDPIERHPKAAAPGQPVRMHNPMCYGCGEQSPQGLHIAVHADEGFAVTATMDVVPWMEGGPGVIHGGILATAFDEVLGTLPLLIGPSAVTVHLEVDYRTPVPVGSTLRFTGTLLGRQRRKVYCEAHAYVGDATEPAATAHGIFVTIDARAHFAEHLDNSAMADEYRQRMQRP